MIPALRPWVPALLCLAAIFVASAQHRVRLPDFDGSDKVSHLAAYSVLGAALAYGGTSEGAPGLRLAYNPDFYAAYVRDPDGNKLAVVCRGFTAALGQ